MQAAVGLSQLEKLDYFVQRRRENFDMLSKKIVEADLDKYFHLPQATPKTQPSWFGYLLTLKDEIDMSRRDLTHRLEELKVGSRLLFAGNLTKQPAFRHANFRVSGSLTVTDQVMERSFWIGVWPGLTNRHLDYMVDMLKKAVTELS